MLATFNARVATAPAFRSSVLSRSRRAPVEECARKEFAILLLVEPCAFNVEELETRHTAGECERVDRELRDRLIRPGVGFVIKDVNGAVADLKEIDVSGDVRTGRGIRAPQQNTVLAFELQDLGRRQPDRNFDRECRRIVRQHEALERLVPEAIIANGRDNERGNAGRKILLLDDNEARSVDKISRLRRPLAVAEQVVGTGRRNGFEKISNFRKLGVADAFVVERSILR